MDCVIVDIDGTRLKIKGDEYRRIHALISRVTPLAIWEAMTAGDNMELLRRELPEEFWTDFDLIVRLLDGHVTRLVNRVRSVADPLGCLTDKEVGLMLNDLPVDVRPLVFPYRKQSGDILTGRARAAVFRSLRPTGNVLPGYVQSGALNRIQDETV